MSSVMRFSKQRIVFNLCEFSSMWIEGKSMFNLVGDPVLVFKFTNIFSSSPDILRISDSELYWCNNALASPT